MVVVCIRELTMKENARKGQRRVYNYGRDSNMYLNQNNTQLNLWWSRKGCLNLPGNWGEFCLQVMEKTQSNQRSQ